MLGSFLEAILEWVVPICELIAAIVILISVGIAFFHYVRNLFTPAEQDVKINLMSGMSLGIELLTVDRLKQELVFFLIL